MFRYKHAVSIAVLVFGTTACKVGGGGASSLKSFGAAAASGGASVSIGLSKIAKSQSGAHRSASVSVAAAGRFIPSNLSDFDCFAVNVISGDIKQAPVCGGSARMGTAVGFFPRGSNIEMNVPYGSNRTFQVWGFANSSGCADVTTLLNTVYGQIPSGFTSPGYVLAEKTVSVTSRKMTVDIDLSYVAGTNPVMCGGPPAPTTTIDSAYLVPGTEVTALTSGSYTSNTNEVCMRYHTTAVSPTFSCYVDGVETTCAQGACANHPDGTTSQYGVHRFTIGGLVPAGTHTFRVVTYDNAYGTSDANPPTFTWTVDTTAPVITLSGFTPGALGGATYYTNSTTPRALVQTDDICSVSIAETTLPVAVAQCVARTVPGSTHGCALSQSVAAGSYTIELSGTNLAGLTTTNAGVTLVVDTTKPTIDVNTVWPMGGSFTAGVSATGTDTAPGAVDATSVRCTIDDSTTSSCAPMSFSTTGGKHTVTLNVNDYAGNRATPVTRSIYIDNASGLAVLGRVKTDGAYYSDESAANVSSPTANIPTDNGLNAPQSSVLDSTFNRLYVSDTTNNRILVYHWDASRKRVVSHKAFDVIGQSDFYGTAAPLTPSATTLSSPRGLAVSSDGTKLFVVDSGHNRVLIYTGNTSTVVDKTADIVLGQPDMISSAANNPGSSSGLTSPYGLYYYEAGDRLLVADRSNCRIVAWNTISTIASGAAINYQLGAGGVALGAAIACPPAAPTNLTLNNPEAVTVDATSSKIFAADTDDNRVAIWSLSDTTGSAMGATPIGQANATSDTAGDNSTNPLTAPQGLTIVTDTSNNRYVAVSMKSGATISKVKFFQIGSSTYTHAATWGSSGTATSSTAFNNPRQLSFDSTNSTMFVADTSNNRINILNIGSSVTSDETIDDVLGHTDSSGVFVSYTAKDANNVNETKLSAPQYVVADSTNNRLYVSDTGNNRVLVYQLNPTNKKPALASAFVSLGIPFSGIAPDTTLLNPYSSWSSDISTASTTLSQPKGLTLDGSNNLWVVDSGNNRLLRFPTGSYQFTTDAYGKTLPLAADRVLCQSVMSSSSTVSCNAPTDVAYDSVADNLYLSDTGNHRVIYWTTASSVTSGQTRSATVFGDGTCNNPADAPSPTCLKTPLGIAITTGITGGVTPLARGLFVADSGNHRVNYFNLVALDTTADGCYGKHGGCTEGAAPTANDSGLIGVNGSWGLSSPSDVAVVTSTNSGYLFVSDYGNSRIAAYSLANEDNRPADADFTTANVILHAIGQSDLVTSTVTTLPTPDKISGPTGMHYLEVSGQTNLLFIADPLWHRVLTLEVP